MVYRSRAYNWLWKSEFSVRWTYQNSLAEIERQPTERWDGIIVNINAGKWDKCLEQVLDYFKPQGMLSVGYIDTRSQPGCKQSRNSVGAAFYAQKLGWLTWEKGLVDSLMTNRYELVEKIKEEKTEKRVNTLIPRKISESEPESKKQRGFKKGDINIFI